MRHLLWLAFAAFMARWGYNLGRLLQKQRQARDFQIWMLGQELTDEVEDWLAAR